MFTNVIISIIVIIVITDQYRRPQHYRHNRYHWSTSSSSALLLLPTPPFYSLAVGAKESSFPSSQQLCNKVTSTRPYILIQEIGSKCVCSSPEKCFSNINTKSGIFLGIIKHSGMFICMHASRLCECMYGRR